MGAAIAGVAEGRGGHALGDAFQQVLQRFQSIMGALIAQDRRVEGRFREVRRTMQENWQATAAHANEALPHGVEERLKRIEQRMEEIERSLLALAELLNQQEKPSHPTNSASAAPAPHSSAPPPLPLERPKELDVQLFQAAKEGREADVRRLLAEGADVNASSLPATPLMIAAYSSEPHVVSLLIKMGADVNAKDRNVHSTALHCAATNDTSGICASLLIRAGALLDCENIHGNTPLQLAAKEENDQTMFLLIAAAASKSAKERLGFTPEDFAH